MKLESGFVYNWINHLKHDPGKACDCFGTVILGLTQPESYESMKRLKGELETERDLLLLMEHCLIKQSRRLDAKYREGFTCIREEEYIRKFLEFLKIWIEYVPAVKEQLFNDGILSRTIVDLSCNKAVELPDIAINLATVLSRYLDRQEGDAAKWFRTPFAVDSIQRVGKAFCQVCFDSRQTRLLAMFLKIVAECNYGHGQKMMLHGIYKTYMLGVESSIKDRIDYLEHHVIKAWLREQLAEALRHTRGFDYQLKAKALSLVVDKLVDAEHKERSETIPTKSLILKYGVLKRYESREDVHDIFVEDILGTKECLTPYELKQNDGSRKLSGDHWSVSDLPQTHSVYQFIKQLEQDRVGRAVAENAFSAYLSDYASSSLASKSDMSVDRHNDGGMAEVSKEAYGFASRRFFYEEEMERLFVLYLLNDTCGRSINFHLFLPTDSSSDDDSFLDDISSSSDDDDINE